MNTRGIEVFDTALGPRAIAWGAAGVCALQLRRTAMRSTP